MYRQYVSTWFSRAKSLSPQKNCMSGCVRFTSRLICSASSVSCQFKINQWRSFRISTYPSTKINTEVVMNPSRMKKFKGRTWKNWCQTLLLPRLKGWSSCEISCRWRGPSNASSSAAFMASISSFLLVTSDCNHKKKKLYKCQMYRRYLYSGSK